MIPVFIFVTQYTTGEKLLVNMSMVRRVHPLKEHEGCVLHFDGDSKVMVRESLEEIDRLATSKSVEIRFSMFRAMNADVFTS